MGVIRYFSVTLFTVYNSFYLYCFSVDYVVVSNGTDPRAAGVLLGVADSPVLLVPMVSQGAAAGSC